jgi:P-type Mg2+ transporter
MRMSAADESQTNRAATSIAETPAGGQESLSVLMERLRSSRAGLTSQEAERRLASVGPNEPAPPQRLAGFRQLLGFLANPLVIILLIASIVTGILGEYFNAALIATMVLLSVALNFVQTYRSQRAAERLRAKVAPTASALRDGQWSDVARRTLVPGDIIRLVAGDLIPADARLVEAHDLHVHQAALTGESMPAEKEATDSEPGSPSQADARNAVFLGTSVVTGSAIALVTATGPATSFGEIASHLVAKPPETEFERGVRRFGLLIMRTVFFLVMFVFLAMIVAHSLQKTPFDPLEAMLFAVSLAVGLTPEFLPMITTVTLGQGALHMAREKVIVKHLESIQNFGSMDILCSDKTGTLTSGDMVLQRHIDAHGTTSQRVLLLAYLNSYNETAIKSPLDSAILQHDSLDITAYHKLDEIPFDFERRRSSVVVESSGERLMITKGAPESVLSCCTSYEMDDHTVPLDDQKRDKCETTYRTLSEQGYRVLAIAVRSMPQQDAYRVNDEHDLTLAGYVAFLDPPLPDAADSLEALRRDGVEVKILTGDNELVARHVCSEVGISVSRVVFGDELNHMGDSALAHIAETTSVFARMSPAQKNRVIIALKSRKHVVGFLGDGINDAPSLHAADVGISVATAADVAKDAADIILLQRSLKVLHSGIIEGRKAFGNVMKYLLMGTSSNFGNMFSMAGAALFLPFLPMLPTQILLNNFMYDLAQVTIPTDNVDPTFIHKPQRWSISTIRDFMVFIGPISSIYDFLTFFVMLVVFHASEPLFHTGWFVESLATQTLVIFVIRTGRNPFRSRPSMPLAITTIAIVLIGALLPFTPLSNALGFQMLPPTYYLILLGMTVTYLLLVQLGKRWLMRRILN